jgi:hypothetical protein
MHAWVCGNEPFKGTYILSFSIHFMWPQIKGTVRWERPMKMKRAKKGAARISQFPGPVTSWPRIMRAISWWSRIKNWGSGRTNDFLFNLFLFLGSWIISTFKFIFSLIQDPEKEKDKRKVVCQSTPTALRFHHISKELKKIVVDSECWELSLCGHWLALRVNVSSVIAWPSPMAPAQRTGSRYDNNFLFLFFLTPDQRETLQQSCDQRSVRRKKRKEKCRNDTRLPVLLSHLLGQNNHKRIRKQQELTFWPRNEREKRQTKSCSQSLSSLTSTSRRPETQDKE